MNADATKQTTRWRTALVVMAAIMAVVTTVFYWLARKHITEGDRIIVVTVVASAELLLLAALAALVLRSDELATGVAAGVAFGASCAFFIAALLFGALSAALGERGGPAIRGAFAMYAIASAVLLVVALIARVRLLWFGFGVVAGIAGLVMLVPAVNPIVEGPHNRLVRARADAENQEIAAGNAVFKLTACILQTRDTRGALPRALSELRAGDCGVPTVPGYTITYTLTRSAINADSADFLLLATPDPTSFPDRAGPVMSDSRGIVFVEHDFPPTSTRTDRGTFTRTPSSTYGLQFVTGHRNAIRAFMQKHDSLVAPASLDEIIVADSNSFGARSIALAQRDTVYRIEYLPPKPGARSMFAVSATCVKYGVQCIRSYRLGYDGRIHGTGAPRSATDADPLILDGEASGDRVNSGIDWRRR